jgi:hypothetical protein
MARKTHVGSCHCGAVRYEVMFEPPAKAIACNCSICSRAGWLLATVGAHEARAARLPRHVRVHGS